MANVRNGVHRPQPGKLWLVREKEAFKTLLRTCAELPIAHRERFILLLLKHAYLRGGTACYVDWGKWNLQERRTAFLSVHDISTDLADSRFEWSCALVNEGSCCRPRERVLYLIGELTKQNFMLEPF